MELARFVDDENLVLHPFAQPGIQLLQATWFLASIPHRELRRTYLTPDSTLPLVCARYGPAESWCKAPIVGKI